MTEKLLMDLYAFDGSFSMWKDVAGIAGNIFAFGLFVSPMPTFRRIMRNKSTEQFSGLPYIYALLNCLICLWYGSPYISQRNLMLVTVNSVGATFQLCYIVLFIMHTDKKNKMRMLVLLLVVFAVVGLIVAGSLQIPDHFTRWYFVGFLSCGSLVSMFASPLFVINLVIRTKSVEFMPFYLSLSTFLMSASFFLFGFLNSDAFVYVDTKWNRNDSWYYTAIFVLLLPQKFDSGRNKRAFDCFLCVKIHAAKQI